MTVRVVRLRHTPCVDDCVLRLATIAIYALRQLRYTPCDNCESATSRTRTGRINKQIEHEAKQCIRIRIKVSKREPAFT